MIDILLRSAQILRTVGFATMRTTFKERQALLFEDQTVIGFILPYASTKDLLQRWADDSRAAVAQYQFGLRRAGQKAWNAYIVLLAAGEIASPNSAALSAIEEDLVGTRKIARGGIDDESSLRNALLSLLPLQAAPMLEAVDIPAEVRQRTTELPSRAVDAFLSRVEEAVVLQVLEEVP
jgi:hypothetical protein